MLTQNVFMPLKISLIYNTYKNKVYKILLIFHVPLFMTSEGPRNVHYSHLSEWNHCDWPRSSALWTSMKILTVCIGKLKKESWFLRIPTPPSSLSKPPRVTKEHLRLLPSLMYLSRLKAQYWFWVTLIHPQLFARLSPVCSGRRERERKRAREIKTGWHFESIIKWERRFQRQRSVEGTPRGPRDPRGPWQTSCAWSPRSQTGEDSRFLFPPQAGSQSVSSWVPAPLSVFSQIFSPFSPNSSHISRLHTCKHIYTHIPCS